MSEKNRIQRRHENRFNYSTQLQGNESLSLNLHHKYFQLYQKFTGEASDQFSFDDGKIKEKEEQAKVNSFYSDHVERDKNAIRQLQYQNQVLKQQLKDSQDMVQMLRSELYLSNTQLEKISKATKFESYEYQGAVRDLREEIEIILEKNKNCDEENRTLKQIIREMNELQVKNSYELSQLRIYSRSRSLGRPYSQCSYNSGYDKENQYDSNRFKQGKIDREAESNRKFINGLKEMYSKIMNLRVVTLKQLWRWLKNIGQMLHRLRKWRKSCRQLLKQTSSKNYQKLVDFINEAMIIID